MVIVSIANFQIFWDGKAVYFKFFLNIAKFLLGFKSELVTNSCQ